MAGLGCSGPGCGGVAGPGGLSSPLLGLGCGPLCTCPRRFVDSALHVAAATPAGTAGAPVPLNRLVVASRPPNAFPSPSDSGHAFSGGRAGGKPGQGSDCLRAWPLPEPLGPDPTAGRPPWWGSPHLAQRRLPLAPQRRILGDGASPGTSSPVLLLREEAERGSLPERPGGRGGTGHAVPPEAPWSCCPVAQGVCWRSFPNQPLVWVIARAWGL